MGDGGKLLRGMPHLTNVWAPPYRARISVQVVVPDSENSIAVPAPLLGAYNASKRAVLGLTETFDRETPDFPGVSLLCPALGFSPEKVAEHAITGMEAGDFLIFTHHCNRDIISGCLSAQLDAIDRQTHTDDGTDVCKT